MLSGIPFKGSFRPKSIVSSPDSRPSSARSSETLAFDPDNVAPEPEEEEVKSLNACLEILYAIFPDVQPEVFREMLSSFSEESRLQVVTEAMLKHTDKWVRGRYKTSVSRHAQGQQHREGSAASTQCLSAEEKFRNEKYKAAVKAALYQEFKGLNHSTIRAVLAEHNYSYTQARPTVLALVTKSWRFSVTNFFMRRKVPSAADHPLIVWQKSDPKTGSLCSPRLIPTASPELNKELYDTLIAPVLAAQKDEQILRDREYANELNDAEAEEMGQMYDCECCFTPSTFEHLSACDNGGHYICFRCIRHSISEALYGQGWARSIDSEKLTLMCIAPVGDSTSSNCTGCLPVHSVQRALMEEADGPTTWRRLEERAASEALLKSQLPLVHCPFCAYAEVDDTALTSAQSWKLKNKGTLLLALVSILHILHLPALRLMVQLVGIATFISLTINYLLPTTRRIPVFAPLCAARTRLSRRRRGLKFTCASPLCSRSSCLSCSKEWRDIHICHESAITSLRTAVEDAVSSAVKRTCPQCNLSFVKSAGCNKLTCVCGYTMCYVCRARIGTEAYAHFCQHFRERGGQCQECDKCDLYKVEDEEMAVRKAAEKAEREWRDKEENEGLGGDVGSHVTGGVLVGGESGGGVLRALGVDVWDRKTWDRWLDRALDFFIA
ncbi:hypothetical protein K490DRAFT_32039 [Saccharata proteae CBS 121410]|uniref:RING-type domain-containing protein n=1 Tax=Saccharata proteae CBS 121410 TaxID=1314787 RepID=A0A9P4HYQ6_9PEZI|nr:hypothetical protein K490DRAFT_32039 [Saccharata proteae CBS 121410]